VPVEDVAGWTGRLLGAPTGDRRGHREEEGESERTPGENGFRAFAQGFFARSLIVGMRGG
jgi:hypothetical protein